MLVDVGRIGRVGNVGNAGRAQKSDPRFGGGRSDKRTNGPIDRPLKRKWRLEERNWVRRVEKEMGQRVLRAERLVQV